MRKARRFFTHCVRFWRDAGATSATAAQSVYMSVYRRRWGAEFALQGARMRIARA